MKNTLRVSVLCLLLLLALGLVIENARRVAAELAYAEAQREAGFWGEKDYRPRVENMNQAFDAIELALALQPAQPDVMLLYSHMLLWRAHWSEDARSAAIDQDSALESLLMAAENRPAHRATWERLQREKQRLGQSDDALRLSRERIAILSGASLP